MAYFFILVTGQNPPDMCPLDTNPQDTYPGSLTPWTLTPRTYTRPPPPLTLKWAFWFMHHVLITYFTLKSIYFAEIVFICDVGAKKQVFAL